MKTEKKRGLWWDERELLYRVIYGDTDRAGVVYYANYLRLFEMGRTEWMRNQLNISYKDLESTGVLFPVVEAQIRYKAPAFYDDMLTIHTALKDSTRVSLTFYYEIKKDGRLLVSGSTKHASTSRDGRLIKMPDMITKALY